MTQSKINIQHLTSEYGDHEIFGSRAQTYQLIERLKAGNDSECVLIAINTFASKDKWKLKDLAGIDRRMTELLHGLKIEHPLPMQRYCWPAIHGSKFANLIISPEATGKTYAHVLYAVSRCILATTMTATNHVLNGDAGHQFEPKETMDLEQLIIHPKFIIICSSQDHVESINRIIGQMKEKAYGIDGQDSIRRQLPPVSRAVNIHQDESKLALRCNESEILIGTPPTILKCLKRNLIHFSKCRKVFFDDLDVSLQLQNGNIRELVKIYLRQSEEVLKLPNGVQRGADTGFRLHLFSRKWTDLVRQFMSTVFVQRTILFGSLSEAAVYKNIKFEIEFYEDPKGKGTKISSLISAFMESSSRDKIGIVTQSDEEAGAIGKTLKDMGHSVKMLRDDPANGQMRMQTRTRSERDLVFIISDPALEFEVEVSNRRKPLDDITHLIHASMPDDMLLFDQRFRLLFKHLQGDKKTALTSTMLIGPHFKIHFAKHLYDLMSRSGATATSSKLVMRDMINKLSTNICWRWATTGLCRLEKLSREDRFGSYCPDRHSFERSIRANKRWPETGQIKLTITHVVSPSEFYFWFESRRRHEDGKWERLPDTGIEHMWKIQQALDKLKSVGTRSTPLDRIRKGRVYGVFFPQESRVDRVHLLDEPKQESATVKVFNQDLEYAKLLPVVKIDHGSRLEVYAKNLIELPAFLAKLPAQCHRAFHLGYKPTDNEPNWLYKTKRRFNESFAASDSCDVTAWLRLNRDNCFWFESMLVSRRLSNIDSAQVCSLQPHRGLFKEGLADLVSTEPPGLAPSKRLEIQCKWNYDKLKDVAQYAFLRRDIEMPEIILLSILPNFQVIARQSCFRAQLENVENKILHEHGAGKLERQNYFAADVYCLARIDLEGKETFNRVKILNLVEQPNDIESPDCQQEPRVLVYCLDHGDQYAVAKSDLYRASMDHIRLLPFQAFKCELANIGPELTEDRAQNLRARQLIVDSTRFADNDYRRIKCRRDEEGRLYLFVQSDEPSVFEPLASALLRGGLKLHAEQKPEYEQPIKVEPREEQAQSRSYGMAEKLNYYIVDLLRDIVKLELSRACEEAAASTDTN